MPLLKSRWKLFAFKHHQISTKPSPRSEFINQKLKGISSPHPWFINRVFMNSGTVSACLIIMKSKRSIPTKDKSAKKWKKRILNIVCQSLSWLGRVTTKPGKWAKLFHSKLHNIVPSWANKQYNQSLFKTKLFFSLENECKAALVKLNNDKYRERNI